MTNVFWTLAAMLLTLQVAAQDISQVKVTLRVEHQPLKEVIKMIENVTSFKFIARAEEVDAVQDLNLEATEQSLDKVLSQLLKGRNIQFRQIGTNIILKKDLSRKPAPSAIIPASYRPQQKYTISGSVRAQKTGETIIGATIKVSGNTEVSFASAGNASSLSAGAGAPSMARPV